MFHPEIINVSQLQKVLHISLGDTWGQLGTAGGHLGNVGDTWDTWDTGVLRQQ